MYIPSRNSSVLFKASVVSGKKSVAEMEMESQPAYLSCGDRVTCLFPFS